MTHPFDQEYWETHWAGATGEPGVPPHPILAAEVAELHPGTALDAGSGEGAEALWLARHGWDVTAVDISTTALRRAAAREDHGSRSSPVRWIEADLTVWRPDRLYDLVTTFYAHPAMPQHAFYQRIADWVAPGGSLLIVGHSHTGHGHGHPDNAVTEPQRIRALLDPGSWTVRIGEVRERMADTPGGARALLRDVVVLAERTP